MSYGRIRTVKPEWLEDELLAAASDEARVLSIALILMADDYGNGRASMAQIASEAWRYELERDDGEHARETLAKASRASRELLAIGFLEMYEVDSQKYFHLRNWSKHQKVDHPGSPRIPGPKTATNPTIRESVARPSRDQRETLAPEGTRKVGGPGVDQDPEQELQVISRKAAASSDPSTIARATGPQPQQSPEKGQEGSPNHGKIPCPADLQLGKDQQSMLGMQIGIEPWAIKAITTSFVCAAMSDQEDKRPHSAWLKCLSKAVSGNWQDPAKRPKREAPDAESQKLAEGFA